MVNDLLPRAYDKGKVPKTNIPLEPITIRLLPDQIEVIDRCAWNLRITRSEFLRKYIIHSLNLPIDGKCVGDDIFGEMKSPQ
jgi:hypothetical protein